MTLNERTLVWAHRGASAYAPENTLEAFTLAAEMGADGVELDVYLTPDGELAVHHDPTPERTTCGACAKKITETRFDELRNYSYTCGCEGFSDVKIPTLGEVYALLAPTKLTVNVELKAGGKGYCEAVLGCALKYSMSRRVIYSSFDHFLLAAIKKLDSEAKVAPLYSFNMLYPWKYGALFGAAALHPHFGQIYALKGYIDFAHELCIRVNPWTVDSPADMVNLASLGADALITNRPDIAIKTLR